MYIHDDSNQMIEVDVIIFQRGSRGAVGLSQIRQEIFWSSLMSEKNCERTRKALKSKSILFD